MPAETNESATYIAVTVAEDVDTSPGIAMEWEDVVDGRVRPFTGGAMAGYCVDDLPNMKISPVLPGRKGLFLYVGGYPPKHVHVFDSELYCLRYRYSSPPRYTGAVELGCACGKQRTFTPSDGQPTKAFWGFDMGSPNPPLPSQPPHLAWED